MKAFILLALVAVVSALPGKFDPLRPLDWSCPLPRMGLTPECPAVSCSRLLDLNPFMLDGLYWFHLNGELFQAWCDMTNGGFMTIVKFPRCFVPETRSMLANDIIMKPHTVWEILDNVMEFNEGKLDQILLNPFLNVIYKNRVWRHWDMMNINRVRVSFFKSGRVMKALEFDAVGADRWSWFTWERLVKSPYSLLSTWHDIRNTTLDFPMFSWRSFPMAEIHNEWLLMSELKSGVERTCTQKIGWFWGVNTFKARNKCQYWDTCRGIHFLFSKLDIHARFSVPQEIEVADAVTISFK